MLNGDALMEVNSEGYKYLGILELHNMKDWGKYNLERVWCYY